MDFSLARTFNTLCDITAATRGPRHDSSVNTFQKQHRSIQLLYEERLQFPGKQHHRHQMLQSPKIAPSAMGTQCQDDEKFIAQSSLSFCHFSSSHLLIQRRKAERPVEMRTRPGGREDLLVPVTGIMNYINQTSNSQRKGSLEKSSILSYSMKDYAQLENLVRSPRMSSLKPVQLLY